MDYDNTKEWQTLQKGQRLPKHIRKEYNYMDSTHNWYYLVDQNEIYIAEYGHPRHTGGVRYYKSL